MTRPQVCIAVFAALLAALSGAFPAKAAGRFLTGGFMGLSLPPLASHYDLAHDRVNSPGFAGSLGFRLAPQWRLEGEMSYSEAGVSGGERLRRLGLVNLYYDLDVGNARFRPFLTIGAGLANDGFYRGGIDGLGIASDSNATGLVWQAGGGLNYALDDDIALSGGYRHIGFSPAVDGGDGAHELRLGVTWKLPVRRNRDGPAHYQP